jgi:hypothetical protein
MPSRSVPLAVLTALVLVLPTTVHAQGSLLSGYGGPGGGEQVLLGEELLGGASGGGSSGAGGAPAGGAPAGSGSTPSDGAGAAPAPAAAGDPELPSLAAAPADRPRESDRGDRGTPGGASRAADPAPAATPVGAPAITPYPTAGDSGSAPLLAASDIFVVLGLLVLVGGVGVLMRRLAPGSPHPR